ncbi:MAG: iron ABC transporter permease [Pseudomonadota bacterium]
MTFDARRSLTGAPDITAAYRRQTLRRLALTLGAAAALFCAFVADVLTGPALLPVGEVLSALFAPEGAEPRTLAIVNAIRLPQALMALTVGAALGGAGALMQTILGNPLASPYTLGFSAAAGFGAAIAILTGISLPFWPQMTIPVAAFVASAFATLIVYGVSRLRGASAEVMVLAGIATLFLFQSLQSLIQYLAAPEILQQIVFWLFGSMGKANWTNLPIAAGIVAVGFALILTDMRRLTALRLGDDRAAAVGVDVGRLRIKIFAVVALLTAGAVAFVGTIGFVGLVAPHIARMMVGEDQRFLIPLSALVGALVMAGASILSKTLSPGGIIPIGIVTAVIGVPFLFFLLLRGQRRYW